MLKIARVLFLTLTVLLFACTQEEIVTGDNAKTGKLVLGNVEVSAQVGDMQSRATLDENILPAGKDFTITVKSESGSFNQTLEKGVFSCILPVGTYTVEAAYGEDVISTDTPYFYGEAKSVEITENTATSVTVEASLRSAIIRPVMSKELLAQYSDYTLTIIGEGGTDMEIIENNKDVFVPAGNGNALWLSGTNQLGESVSNNWELNNLSPQTRYIISCDADLPGFTLPEQSETNAWSKFIYITPMTAENMTSHSEMADKVMENIVYEASADGSTWLPAGYDSDKGKWVIKNLNPNTTYTLRSRFGAVLSSNTQSLTTENAQDVPNGSMEDWTSSKLHGGNGSFDADLYCDYCTSWTTRNEKTTDGAGNASGWNNYGVKWRWCSGTVSTSSVSGNAAELSTLAFYNQRVTTSTIGLFGSRDKVWNRVLENHSEYVAYLLLGTYDLSTDTYTLGITHPSRPVSISFDYEYAPVEGDQCIAYARLYDAEGREIATTVEFKSSKVDEYTTKKLMFNYSDMDCKATSIGVFFQSGTDTDINKMQQVHGSYNASPYKEDRIVGSVLKIDNVKLNYNYE